MEPFCEPGRAPFPLSGPGAGWRSSFNVQYRTLVSPQLWRRRVKRERL